MKRLGWVFVFVLFVLALGFIDWCEAGEFVPYSDNGTEEATGYYVETNLDSEEWLKDMGWMKFKNNKFDKTTD